MDIFIKASQFILSLSILIVLHELGHFIPAKLFKTKVEKFYLFFNPYFSVFKKKIGETEYGLGWLPLGGYVKISGMIDESMDKEQMKKPAEPWEFRAKPAWQRLIIMLGGVTVNIILAILIYIGVMFTWGRTYLPIENAKYGIHSDSLLTSIGFVEGDIPVMVNGVKPLKEDRLDYGKLTTDALLGHVQSITVKRGEEQKVIKIPSNYGELVLESANSGKQEGIFMYRMPFAIDSVLAEGPAVESGLQKGDVVISINGIQTPFYGDFVTQALKNKNKKVTIGVKRDGQELEFISKLDEDGRVGVFQKKVSEYFDIVHLKYSFIESIPEGLEEAEIKLIGYVEQIPLLFSKSGISQLGGFVSMGKVFSPSWNWQSFWSITAWLSVILAFMNLLPIPALDGGHAMFLIYELIARRKPSDKFMEYAQMAGMSLLLLLMLFANGNDLIKLFS